MAIDPVSLEQFFRRNSSGDWLYVGYGPSVYSRVIGAEDMDWLMEALPTLCAWKRWTVMLFSVPLVWLIAIVLNFVAHLPSSEGAFWIRERIEVIGVVAMVLLLLFIVSTAVLSAIPEAKEFGKMFARLKRDEPIGIDRLFKNTGAVNGRTVSTFLVIGFGYLVVPGVFRADVWLFFLPFTIAWAWIAWHVWAGAFWKPRPGEAWTDD